MRTREIITDKITHEFKKNFIKFGWKENLINEEIFFSREFDLGNETAPLPIIRFLPDKVIFNLLVLNRIGMIEEYWEKYSIDLGLQSGKKHTLNINPIHLDENFNQNVFSDGFGSFEIRLGGDEFNKNLAQIMGYVFEELFQSLEPLKNIDFIDAKTNAVFPFSESVHGILNQEGLMFRRIIIAKQAKNPQFDNLSDFIRSTFNWYVEQSKIPGQEFLLNYPVIFEKVYNSLKVL